MTVTPEQAVVDTVRIAITDEPHLAGSEEAGVMMIARFAYRAGKAEDPEANADPKKAIMEALPHMKEPVVGVEQVHPVYAASFRHVMEEDVFANHALWAYEEGRKAQLNG